VLWCSGQQGASSPMVAFYSHPWFGRSILSLTGLRTPSDKSSRCCCCVRCPLPAVDLLLICRTFATVYGHTPAMLVAGHSVLPLLFITFFFLSPPNLRGPLADFHQTLPHVRWWPRFIKFGQKFWWCLCCKISLLKNIKIFVRFRNHNKTLSIGKWHCKLCTLPHR